MDERLERLIHDYLDAVRSAVMNLQLSGIPLPKSRAEWEARDDMPAHKKLPMGGGEWRKQGKGCEVKQQHKLVSFDFGLRGEIEGFNLAHLADFAAGRLYASYEYANLEELDASFNTAVFNGSFLRKAGDAQYYLPAALRPFPEMRGKSLRKIILGSIGTLFSIILALILPEFIHGHIAILLALPGAYALMGALELLTGVEFISLSKRWDGLRGWQRGVFGLSIAAAAFFIFMAGAVLLFTP